MVEISAATELSEVNFVQNIIGKIVTMVAKCDVVFRDEGFVVLSIPRAQFSKSTITLFL